MIRSTELILTLNYIIIGGGELDGWASFHITEEFLFGFFNKDEKNLLLFVGYGFRLNPFFEVLDVFNNRGRGNGI